MNLMNASKISGTALAAHRMKLNVIAENLANVDTTRSEDGGPYRRKMVVLKGDNIDSFESVVQQKMKKDQSGGIELSPIEFEDEKTPDNGTGVRVDRIVRSQEDFHLVYNPAHPDADPDTGYVK
ncbi:MAG TPA: flagellar basal body protein, partial [Desulfobacter sp.]|nr:flagellar basal body protein [Desulfobacter sp.]